MAVSATTANTTRPAPLTADTLDPETFDPLVPRVAQQAMSKSPIRLPWQARVLPLGMFFRSAATASNPFAPQSAFDVESLNSALIVFTAYDGNCSFRSSEAISSSASTDHLSVGVGAGVDMWALEASVSVSFDKDVMENRDSNKVSVLTSYRAGSVAFVRSPELSEKAFKILHSQGVDEFKAVFGDYYVGGYRLGGDASILFSTDNSSRSEKETKRVSITVESCFGDYHGEDSTSSTRTDQHQEVRFSAYSTIEQLIDSDTVQMGSPKFQAVIQRGREIHRRAQRLEDSVAEVLAELGVGHGELLTHSQSSQLCERAVVVELLLMPVECLRQVRYWTIAM